MDNQYPISRKVVPVLASLSGTFPIAIGGNTFISVLKSFLMGTKHQKSSAKLFWR